MKFNPSEANHKIPSENKGTIARDDRSLVYMVVELGFAIEIRATHDPEEYLYVTVLDDDGNTGVVVPMMRTRWRGMVELEIGVINTREV